MTTFKRPILAASLLSSNTIHSDENILAAMQKLRYPVLATLKIDGIRAIKLGDLYSRTLKLIPNKSIRARALKLPAGFDMELYNPSMAFDEIASIVMSREHPRSDEIEFHILDNYRDLSGYRMRMFNLRQLYIEESRDIEIVQEFEVVSPIDLIGFFLATEERGGEGICFRTPNSPYKQGRSTLKEQYLVKLCRNLTSEAVIIGFEEQMENGNETKRNEVGAMDRSSEKANLYGKDTLGALVVRDCKSGKEFKIGTGFDDRLRFNIWHGQAECLGKVVTYKYKGGGKDLPRCPVWKGFRKD